MIHPRTLSSISIWMHNASTMVTRVLFYLAAWMAIFSGKWIKAYLCCHAYKVSHLIYMVITAIPVCWAYSCI